MHTTNLMLTQIYYGSHFHVLSLQDEIGAANQLKKHNTVEKTIDDFASTVRDLNDRATQLIDAESPEKENIARRQAQVTQFD